MSAPWLLEMTWRDICFAHWRADGELLERTLPPNVTLDRYAGDAWLSVVPFRMTGIHLRYAPSLPGFTDVPEINLRTYVRVGALRGIWFYSLDADGPVLVRSARMMTSLPYYDARVLTSEDEHGIRYTSERTDRNCVAGRFAARYRAASIEHAIEAGSIEAFFHERYHFFTRRGSQLVRGEIRHRPWTIGPIAIVIGDNTLGELIAHPLAGPPDFAFFGREQHVRACAVQQAGV